MNPVPLWSRNGSVIGMSLMTSLANDHERVYKNIENAIERVAKGELEVVLDREFSLAEAGKAHAYIEGRSAFGRVLMRP